MADFEEEIIITGLDTEGNPAILSAEGSEKRVVTIMGGAKIRFENIEISGGMADNGGGILVREGSRLTIGPGTKITNNNASGDGGGVYVYEGGSIEMPADSTGEISGNMTASKDNGSGGGICLDTGAVFTMESGVVSRNNGGRMGGGIFADENAVVTISGGSISENIAESHGGGILIFTGKLFELTGGEFIRVEGFNTPPFRALKKGIKPRIQIPYENNNLVPLGRGC